MANLIYEETFEGASWFPTSNEALINFTHGIENCNNNSTTSPATFDWTLSRVTDIKFQGTKSARFEIRKDQPRVGSSQKVRSEVTVIKEVSEGMEQEMWFSFAILFPSNGFEYDTKREAINQFYEDGSTETSIRCEKDTCSFETFSPPTGTSLVNYDLFRTSHGTNAYQSISSMQLIQKDVWHEFVFHFIFSTGAGGLVEIWRNGTKIHTINGKNIHITGELPKWKIGLYKASFLDGSSVHYSRVLYFDNIRIGNSSATLEDMVSAEVTPNVPPSVNAGVDVTMTLPTNSTTLIGSATDSDGTITSYLWTKLSGPSGGNISSATSSTTNITGLNAGTYIYRLTATDNGGATGSDNVQILVNPALNTAPTANAGVDKTITLPTSSVTVTGSGSDSDGTITNYLWVKVSGPSGGNITSPTLATTSITSLQAGTYAYKLTVTDNNGATASDIMQILVNPATPPANQPPTAEAGSNQTITLPTSTANLSGSGTDGDGTITSYLWAKVSGPSGGTISSPTTASTGLTGLIAGVYVYRLTVTDNNNATASDTVQITVNPAVNSAPTVNAGTNIEITLPVNSTGLAGTATDSDGTIASLLWIKSSGPDTYTIAGETTLYPTISGLIEGTYVFRLIATDDVGATSSDTVTVTVNPATSTPSGVSITSFTLINAKTEGDVLTMVDGETYSLKQVGKYLNIRANVNATVDQVKFKLTGPKTRAHVDKKPPYALHGNTFRSDGSINYYYGIWGPPKLGTYILTAIPKKDGVVGTSKTITFTFIK